MSIIDLCYTCAFIYFTVIHWIRLDMPFTWGICFFRSGVLHNMLEPRIWDSFFSQLFSNVWLWEILNVQIRFFTWLYREHSSAHHLHPTSNSLIYLIYHICIHLSISLFKCYFLYNKCYLPVIHFKRITVISTCPPKYLKHVNN